MEIQRQPVVSSHKPSSTPGAACCSEDSRDSYTYRQLRQRAESVGAWLQRSGLQPGARCAVLASNSPDWVAVYLGIVAAGHTDVPLDTAFNGEQVEKLLRDCGASLIFADAKHLPIARHAGIGHQLKVALIDDPNVPRQAELPGLGEMYQAGADGFTPSSSKPEDIACILYTSGTTSDPKGVMLTDGNLTAEIEWILRFVRFDSRTRCLASCRSSTCWPRWPTSSCRWPAAAWSFWIRSTPRTSPRPCRARHHHLLLRAPVLLSHPRAHLPRTHTSGRLAQTLSGILLSFRAASQKLGFNLGKLFFKKVHAQLGPNIRYFCTGGSRLRRPDRP